MAWVESSSACFNARHDSASREDALRVLRSLELERRHLSALFPASVDGLTVVMHRSTLSLSLARPLLPAAWLATAPAARRYLAGFAGREEIHMLAPAVLASRASAVPGSREMLALSAEALYARRVITESNQDLPRRRTPVRFATELRWAWLLEGAARWFAGQTDHARPAIARRLREGRPPQFPPGPRDALLLGGTVIDLLVSERGEEAAARFACRLHRQGARAALSKAFGGRSLTSTEGEWRAHLTRLASAA